MHHLIETYNELQTELLAPLPVDKRYYMARLLRIDNATYWYYNRAKELSVFNKQSAESVQDLLAWLGQQINPTLNYFIYILMTIWRDCQIKACVEGCKKRA